MSTTQTVFASGTFTNGDLHKELPQLRHVDAITLSKSVIDNDGEDSYYLDVNDNGYFYANETDRDFDFQTLLFIIQTKYPELPVTIQNN